MKSTTWKTLLKFLGIFVLLFSLLTVSSCRTDDPKDDPVDNDFFVGTYKGNITYTDGTESLTFSEGSVTVTKIASSTKYNFHFSNGIPDLNGVEFNKEGDHILVMVGGSATSYIRIDNNELKILYTNSSQTWTANCTR